MEILHKNFNAGELSPELDSRVDLAKYANGLKTLLNGVVHPHGGASGRSGTVYVATAGYSANPVALLPFVFSTTQAYVLELGEDASGNGYVRFYMDGWQILSGASAYELKNGVGGVSIPWTSDQFDAIRYCQSADILFLTHPDWDAVYEIARTGHTNWTVSPMDIGPSIGSPDNLALSVTGSTGTNYRYMVTAVDAETDEESTVEMHDFNVTAVTQANPAVVTAPGHNYVAGQVVTFDSVGGMTELNGNEYTVASPSGDTFQLSGINSTAYGAYTSGGKVERVYRASAAATLSSSNYVEITWDAIPGASRYLVYREYAGTYGYLGSTTTERFRDEGLFIPNTEETPPIYRDPFDGTDNVPSLVTFHKERFTGLAPNNGPQKVYFSQAANYYNFNKSFPLRDDDAATFNLLANGQDQILWAVSLKNLVMGTAAGEWALVADSQVGISPVSPPELEPQSYWGAEAVPPAIIGNVIVFVRKHGRRLHELVFDYVNDGYKSEDLLVMSEHLTSGPNKTIKQLAWSQDPDSILWCRRADGILLGMTYIRAHEVAGWHRHDFGGEVESIAAIPADGYDELWMVIKRTIDGSDVRYIERLKPTFKRGDVAEDAFCVDCGATYWEGVDITDMAVAVDGTVTVNAAGHGLSDGDTVRISHLPEKEYDTDDDLIGDEINYLFDTVTNVAGDDFDLVTADGSDWPTYASTDGGTAAKCITTVTGLSHLEGETVQILADGSPAANQVVDSGQITLQEAAAKIHVGLPYNVDIETMRPVLEQVEASGQGKKLRIVNLEVRVSNTIGLKLGVSFGQMWPVMFRSPQDPPARPIEPKSMVISDHIMDAYQSDGRICIRQDLPLPISIIGIVPDLEVVE